MDRPRLIRFGPTADAEEVPVPVQEAPEESRPAIEALSETVRRVYVACFREKTGNQNYGASPIPAWDGGEDAFARRTRPIWPKIARKIVELDADPFTFVQAQFAAKYTNPQPPTPNELLAPAAVEVYRKHSASAADVEKEYERDVLAVQQSLIGTTRGLGWEYLRGLRYALRDVVDVHASPLFRCVIARAYKQDDVAQRFWPAAVMQYAIRLSQYNGSANWSALIDDQLRVAGGTVRDRLTNG